VRLNLRIKKKLKKDGHCCFYGAVPVKTKCENKKKQKKEEVEL
jgi:hypothetical protein